MRSLLILFAFKFLIECNGVQTKLSPYQEIMLKSIIFSPTFEITKFHDIQNYFNELWQPRLLLNNTLESARWFSDNVILGEQNSTEGLTTLSAHYSQIINISTEATSSTETLFSTESTQNVSFETTNSIVTSESPLTSTPSVSYCKLDLLDMALAILHPSNYSDILKMIDAFGKPSSGISYGALNWYGSYYECFVSIPPSGRPTNTSRFLNGHYCMFSLSDVTNKLDILANLPMGLAITEGICIPNTCSIAQLRDQLENVIDKLKQQAPPLENLTLTSVQCPPLSQDFDSRAIGVLFMLSVFLCLMTIGTVYDLIFCRQILRFKDVIQPVNDDKELLEARKESEKGTLQQIFLSFSIYTNALKILSTSKTESTLSCINGIRFLSMSWVILCHVYAFGVSNFADPMRIFLNYMDEFSMQVIINGFFSVDTFFFLSGTLVAYLFMKNYKSSNFSWIAFYLHRFWRLSPPYFLIMGSYIAITKYFGNGPLWKYSGFENDYCKSSWWYNLLYINNFYDFGTSCMGWTWYLANDMQFYVISPILLYLLVRNRNLGMIVICFLIFASWITSGCLTVIYDLPMALVTTDITKISDYMAKYYIKPYCRITPYLIGIMLGTVLYETKCRYTFKNKLIPNLLWMISIATNIAVVYGLKPSLHHPASLGVRALYNSVSRTAWAMGLAWVTFACITGYGGFVNTILSWNFLIPLSRLTYCAYLIHPVVIYVFYFDQKMLFTFNNFIIVYLFLANLVISYLVAFVLALAFESPTMSLEKILRMKISHLSKARALKKENVYSTISSVTTE